MHIWTSWLPEPGSKPHPLQLHHLLKRSCWNLLTLSKAVYVFLLLLSWGLPYISQDVEWHPCPRLVNDSDTLPTTMTTYVAQIAFNLEAKHGLEAKPTYIDRLDFHVEFLIVSLFLSYHKEKGYQNISKLITPLILLSNLWFGEILREEKVTMIDQKKKKKTLWFLALLQSHPNHSLKTTVSWQWQKHGIYFS